MERVRLGRPCSSGFEEFGFTLTKQNKKFCAICKVCNRTLRNTAFARLKCHRNICKPPSADSHQLSSLFTPDDLHKHNESKFTDCEFQISSTDCFKQRYNKILADSGIVRDDIKMERNFPSFNAVTHMHDMKSEMNLKKVAVLELIQHNKHILFENPISDKIEVWIKVLRKAQSLGLASEDRHWTYARDSLYEMWKNRTLAKKDCLESDGWNDKLDIVDLAILKILGIKPPILNSIEFSDLNGNCSLQEDQQNEDSPTNEWNNNSNRFPQCKRKSVSTQTSDEMHETELQIKRLKCEALEIEIYKQSLQVLQLERELNLPPSKCTAKFFPELQGNSADNVKTEVDE